MISVSLLYRMNSCSLPLIKLILEANSATYKSLLKDSAFATRIISQLIEIAHNLLNNNVELSDADKLKLKGHLKKLKILAKNPKKNITKKQAFLLKNRAFVHLLLQIYLNLAKENEEVQAGGGN